MANSKDILIVAEVPFCYYENDGLARRMAYLQSPTSSLAVAFSKTPVRMERNEHGGETAYYSMCITGVDSLSWAWLDYFKKELEECHSKIVTWQVVDPS